MIVAVLAAAAITAAAAGGGPDPVAQARAFTVDAHLSPVLQSAPSVSRADAVRWAKRRTRRIPLPRGGNFNGIRWEDAAEPLWLAEIDLTLQFNARCQWQRAQADGRDPGTATAVLDEISRWPVADAGQSVGQTFLSAQDTQARLDACRATHEREVDYAREHGMVPSS